MCRQGGKKLRVGPDPAFRQQAGLGLDALRHLFGRERIAHIDIDGRHATCQVEQALRHPQRHIDVALVDPLVAEIERAGHRQGDRGAARGGQAQLVADDCAQVFRQFDADHDVGAVDPDPAGHQLVGQRRDAGVVVQFDPGQGHRIGGIAAGGEARTGDDRRNVGNVGHAFDLVA